MARKALTPEEKQAAAERLTKAREAKKAAQNTTELLTSPQEEEKLPNKDWEELKEQNQVLMLQIKQMQGQLEELQSQKVIRVSTDSEKVHLLWQAEVADENVVLFGDGGMFGRVVGKTGLFSVPKSELSRLLDSMNRLFLERRWLIVLDGLDDNEREALGVNYKEGELLDRKAFSKMVELGNDMLEIYPQLCAGHKEMVAKRYYEAWQQRNPAVTRERVVALNRMSKAAGSEHGDFAQIIEEMNAEDTK